MSEKCLWSDLLVGIGGLALAVALFWLAFRIEARPSVNFSSTTLATQLEVELTAPLFPTAQPTLLEVELPFRSSPTQPPRAALVDQVALTVPNPELVQTLLHDLQAAGFQTDLYPSSDVTVDFYRTLPAKGYRLIVLRTHSTSQVVEQVRSADNPQDVRYREETMYERVGLFTSERYSDTRWLPEQLRAEVGGGSLPYGDQDALYFGINSDFVRNRMTGRFDDTLIIIAGCQSLAASDMAVALIERGAAVVIGWDEWVAAAHNDRALVRLLQALVVEGQTVARAVALTMAEIGPDPQFQSVLTYLPQAQGNWTLRGQPLVTLEQASDEGNTPIVPSGGSSR